MFLLSSAVFRENIPSNPTASHVCPPGIFLHADVAGSEASAAPIRVSLHNLGKLMLTHFRGMDGNVPSDSPSQIHPGRACLHAICIHQAQNDGAFKVTSDPAAA